MSVTTAKPSRKAPVFPHWQGTTTLPVLSIKPYMPLASTTTAIPSLKVPTFFHWQGMTTFPVLSMKPRLNSVMSSTGAKPSLKDPASNHLHGMTSLPVLSINPQFSLASWTRARPSLNSPRYFHCAQAYVAGTNNNTKATNNTLKIFFIILLF